MLGADYRSLMTVIDKLYAGAADPAEWPHFLSAVASLLDAENAFICQIEDRRRILDYVGLPQVNRDIHPVRRYETLIDEDPRVPAFSAIRAQPVHCRMATSDERLHASRGYRDYLRPLNIEYAMVVVFTVRERVTHDLGLTRGPGQAFDARDCALLNELVPHLERSFAVSRAIADSKQAAAVPPSPPLQPQDDAAVLQSQFGLTPAQARLTGLLLTGRSTKDIAAALGITDESAREYLKRIYRKTGTHRQTDLVRVAAQALAPR
jgi:DNA-binding CsgD family transcriptional regulator